MGRWLADWRGDLRFALRDWARRPGTAASVILMLALGIGAVTIVYALAYAEMWRPYSVRDPATLERVVLWGRRPVGVLLPNQYLALKGAGGFAGIAAETAAQQVLRDRTGAVTVFGESVTPNLLGLLGLAPAWGRDFLPSEGEPGHDAVAMIGYELWQSRFGGARDILGRTVNVNNRAYTIVGVLPEALSEFRDYHIGFWMPTQVRPTNERYAIQGDLDTTIRLRPGTTPQEADELLAALSKRLDLRFGGEPVKLVGFNWAEMRGNSPGRPLLLALLAAVAMLLLIACANVAGLLLARGVSRRHEFAVRHALGATRGRIVRQLLTEAALLATAAGGAGILLADWALPILKGTPLQYTVTRLKFARLDPQVLALAVLATVATVVVAALLPAMKVSRLAHGGPAVGASGEMRPLLRSAFLIAEVALSVVLLTGAGLIGRSLWRLALQPTGLDEAHLAAIEFSLTNKQGTQPAAGEMALHLLDTMRGRLAWRRLALSDTAPFDSGYMRGYSIGAGRPMQSSAQRVAGPGYFATVGQKLLLGRDFDGRDAFGAPSVAIVNQAWAKQYLQGRSPLGVELYYSDHAPGAKPGPPTPHRIIGVVSNARDFTSEFDIGAELYLPIQQASLGWMALVYNAARPDELLPATQRILAQAAPALPITNAQTAAAYAGDDIAQERFQASSFAFFAGIGLLFALAGIWALVAFSVQQRQREFGIRMALGADMRHILAQALRHTLALTAVGAACGVAGACAASRLLASMLFQLSPTDPATYGGVVALFLVIAAVAAFIPARRALEADPAATLRCE